jgi:hypothetical protein
LINDIHVSFTLKIGGENVSRDYEDFQWDSDWTWGTEEDDEDWEEEDDEEEW